MTQGAASGCLQAEDLVCRMGGRELLHGLSFKLQAGQFTAILGPNGAGKSTLLSMLCGQRKPDGGRLLLDGSDLFSLDAASMARRRALLPQDTGVAFDFSVHEVAELGRYPHRLNPTNDEEGIVAAAMASADVTHLAHRSVTTLSGGERARAQLARVLAQIWLPLPDGASRWLLLDEPTAALDLHHQHEVLRLSAHWAHQQGVGVIAVLHDLNLALRYADHVLVLEQGNLAAQGAPQDVLDEDLLARVWRVSASSVTHPDGTRQLLVA